MLEGHHVMTKITNKHSADDQRPQHATQLSF